MSGRRVLVLAAHADDELLGCGGTVALHKSQGDEVHALIACEAESLRHRQFGADLDCQLAKASRKAGYAMVKRLCFPDQGLDIVRLTDIIGALENEVRQFRPHIVYTHHGGDLNKDHSVLFSAAMVALRPTERYIESVYCFETPSSTEWAHPQSFSPDTWVDISSTLAIKLNALEEYESELRPFPHPRSLEALTHRARNWGSYVCVDAAEVFMTVRRVCSLAP